MNAFIYSLNEKTRTSRKRPSPPAPLPTIFDDDVIGEGRENVTKQEKTRENARKLPLS